jgi:hypothetical protein
MSVLSSRSNSLVMAISFDKGAALCHDPRDDQGDSSREDQSRWPAEGTLAHRREALTDPIVRGVDMQPSIWRLLSGRSSSGCSRPSLKVDGHAESEPAKHCCAEEDVNQHRCLE